MVFVVSEVKTSANESRDMSHILKGLLVDVLKLTLRRKREPEKSGKRLHQFSRERGVCLAHDVAGGLMRTCLVIIALRLVLQEFIGLDIERRKRRSQGRVQCIDKLKRQGKH